MYNFCDVDLSKFKNALELDGIFTELQEDNNILYKNLIAKFLHAKLPPPFIQDNALLTEHINQYLFLSRINTMADIIHIYKPDKFTIKMPIADLCPSHQLITKDFNNDILYTEKTWLDCNNCYIKHAKNKVIKQATSCLNNFSSLPAGKHYLQHLDYTLGMRVASCVRILINLEFYNKYDYELETLYAHSKDLLASSLYKLLKVREATVKNTLADSKNQLIAAVKQKLTSPFMRRGNH